MHNDDMESQIKLLAYQYGIILGTYDVVDGNLAVSTPGDVVVNSFININKKLPFHFINVGGDFVLSRTKINSLIGVPRYIGGRFDLTNCNELIDLLHFPDLVVGDVYLPDTIAHTVINFEILGSTRIFGELFACPFFIKSLNRYKNIKILLE
jgi:hypothetical protein